MNSSSCTAGPAAEPIDRHALVTRHNIRWDSPSGEIPLGNGEFCFNADGTGLQTFGGNTMSHWGWHSFPLPEGATADDVPATGTIERGLLQAGMRQASAKPAVSDWMFHNPHRLNLGRLRLVRRGGLEALAERDVSDLARHHDLWTGLHTSTFQVDGQPVRVQTCVHPELDLVAMRIESPLLDSGDLEVGLDFPYPALQSHPWSGDFARADGHTTTLRRHGVRADFVRQVDTSVYHVALGWSAGAELRVPDPAEPAPGLEIRRPYRLLAAGRREFELVCGFAAKEFPASLPSFQETRRASAERWQRFWGNGGAIDLSASRDARWKELERRIVLSQYLMAVQSAGSWPSPEIGLMGIDMWVGQFHMEMVWWHLAHYGLWDRWDLADQALGCYQRFLPMARRLADQFGYKGAKWGKEVGPESRTAPWDGSFVLHWQQPHPIFLAELEYRLRPTQATLDKWKEIVFETADYLADFPTLDAATGLYHLTPIMPPCELGITKDTVFDLAYFRFGLDKAQEWRTRLGLRREARWDEVRAHLAPLPKNDGLFVHCPAWRDETYTKRAWEHPDPLGVLGMLPPMDGVDRQTAHRTLEKIAATWDWDRCWGWDFPWAAMAAARLGEPALAVDMLLHPSEKNRYDQRGVCTGGPCPYLPGNGGLLYAVAMMAVGWDGCPDRHAPGFPNAGTWAVRWEGLRKAP